MKYYRRKTFRPNLYLFRNPRLFFPRFKGPRKPLFQPSLYGPRNFTIKNKLIVLLILILIFVSFIGSVNYLGKKLRPSIITIAEVRSKQIAVAEINRIVKDKIANNTEYEELIRIHKDNNDKIVLIEPITYKINKLQTEAALEVNNALKNLGREKLGIPLGQITGNYLLATYGPKIPIRMAPVGTVEVKRVDEFEAAGINQTRHLLSFQITGRAKIFSPLLENEVDIMTEVLITDNIIIGEVPETYLNVDLESLRLDRILEVKP